MSQGTNAAWPGLIESSQYLPLTTLPSSLALISEHDSAGNSWMEPRGAVIRVANNGSHSSKLHLGCIHKKSGNSFSLQMERIAAFYPWIGSAVCYHQSSSGISLKHHERTTSQKTWLKTPNGYLCLEMNVIRYTPNF